MKKILLSLILTVVLLGGVTYAYFVSQVKTNEQIIKIGNADVSGATLTPLFDSTAILVPQSVTTTGTNEVTYLQFELYVESDTLMNYHLDSELPSEFELTTNRPSGVYYYTTGETYIITLKLLEQVDYSTYTFYLWVNFI